MKKIKILAKIALCVILIVSMLTQATLLVFAQEETLYLKEVQIIYSIFFYYSLNPT